MSSWVRVKYFVRLHFRPAFYISVVVFLTGFGVEFWEFSGWRHHWLSPLVASAAVFAIFSFLSLRHEEILASVEAYQSHAFLMHLKVNGALAKIQGVVDICPHGDRDLNHENCKAAIRRQIRIIEASTGRAAAVVDEKEFEIIKGGKGGNGKPEVAAP